MLPFIVFFAVMECGRIQSTISGGNPLAGRLQKGAAAAEKGSSFHFVSCRAIAFFCPARPRLCSDT